jgi:hypothetical protein
MENSMSKLLALTVAEDVGAIPQQWSTWVKMLLA